MTVIGLTGGIASGKSTAAGWLRDLGAIVIDADRLGHRVYEPGSSGFEAVVNGFGHDLVSPDGTINRQLLGGKVFGDPALMKKLTDIVWPEIQRLAAQEIADIKRRDPKAHVVLEAAVLVEANWFGLVDQVWVVTVEPSVAKARLMSRNNLTDAQAQSRIDAQISNKERLLHAYAKFDNSGTLDQFRQRVEREWKRFTKDDEKPPRAAKTPAVRVAATTARATAKPAATKATAAKPAATKPAAVKSAAAKAVVTKSTAAAKPAAATKSTAAAKPAAATKSTAAAKPAAATKSTAAAKPAAATKTIAARSTTARTVAAKPVAAAKAAPTRTAAAKAAPAKATAAKAAAPKRAVRS